MPLKKLRFIVNTDKLRLTDDAGEPTTSTITILRVGKWDHPSYGSFEATKELFAQFVKNFNAGKIGKDIAINLAHNTSTGAAGWIKKVFVEGNRLRAVVEWTELGVDKIKKKIFRYISAEYIDNYQHPETGESLGGTLLGAALCVDPFVGNMDPVELSASAARKNPEQSITVFHRALARQRLSNTVAEKVEEDAAARKINESFWAAQDLVRDIIDDDELDAATKKEKVKKVISDFLAFLEGGDLLDNLPAPTNETKGLTMNKYLELLRKRLSEVKGLPQTSIDNIVLSAQGFITGAEPEETAVAFIDNQVRLAESLIPTGAPADDGKKTLSTADISAEVQKQLAAERAKEAEEAKKLSDRKTANEKALTDAITGAQGIDDDTKKTLSEALLPTITGAETEAQVKAIAETQIKLAEGTLAKQKLGEMGYRGRVTLGTSEDENAMKFTEEELDRRLGLVRLSDSERYPQRGGLTNQNKDIAARVLAHFDARFRRQLMEEGKALKQLATGSVSDAYLPNTVVRTAIREAVADLIGTAFVSVDTTGDPTVPASQVAPVVQIPFVQRDGAPTDRQMKVFEGQAIPYAYLKSSFEDAYVNAVKLALKLSNEAMFFTRMSSVDYDAQKDGLFLLVRVIKEMTDRRYFDEILLASDEYAAAGIVGEDLGADTDGSNTTFQLANWPLVPSRVVYNLKGAIISTANAITVTYKGGAISEYDGSGQQAAGDYYRVTDYNLGQFQIVNELGAVQTPAAASLVVDYFYATNVVKFDTNFDDTKTTNSAHLDGLLDRFGQVKATLSTSPRYCTPNFSIMSPVLNNMLTQAKKFTYSSKVEGTSLKNDGNLDVIKAIAAFSTNAPGLRMADRRIVIGERGVTKHRIALPFSVGAFQERRDGSGNFVGEKDAYGEQYDAVHTPGGPNNQVKGTFRSIVVYNSTSDLGPF